MTRLISHFTSLLSVGMDRRGHNLLSFVAFVLFLGYVVVTAQWRTTGVDREQSLLSAAASCATSRRCGWLIHDNDEGTYSSRDSEDWNVEAKGDGAHCNLEYYQKQPNEIQVAKNTRYATFKLVTPADSKCKTTTPSCGSPMPLNESTVRYYNQTPGSKATYTCNEGWSFCGPVQKEITCLNNGSWEGLVSICRQDPWITKLKHDQIPCPLRVGTVIEFTGIPLKTISFNFRLQCHNNTISLDVSASRKSGKCILGCRIYDENDFGNIKSTTCMFRVDRQFKMSITVESRQYVINVDGETSIAIRHGTSMRNVQSYVVSSSVNIIDIKFSY